MKKDKMTKTIKLRILMSVVIFTISGTFGHAQSMEKNYKTVHVEMKINAPAERVWEAMVLDYGEISNFSPYIHTSEYTNGSLKGEVGAERKCNFNEKGSQWSHERIGDIDSKNMVMRNVVIDGAKLPLNFDNSQAFYRVKDNGDGTATASYEFQFRTKPAFLGVIAKGGFKKQMSGTLVGLKHYVETGERVTAGNEVYKRIKKDYPKATQIKTK
ncbi:SRPBCC family protein [Ulvibacterium marinum]|uniref:SRPBCC family protein n=1 Tax=Ulvibacterium marinum TaxID=2419782 RepID=A0A3B0CFI9_9FLAO|nr:SRPBCC family protein [Ulvibacterium marinum]RKN82547.1 SRPBCC family protein [Ulvibacterium marinum]